MKRAFFILILISVFVAGTAVAADYMKGMKYLTFKWTGVDLDHTYHCAQKSGTTTCWSWTGGESGGSYVTNSAGYGNWSKSKCTSTNWGCRFVYGVQGVCHQEANRGLYTAGTKISACKGYWLSSALFGTYGGWSNWLVCRTSCSLW